MGIGNTGERLKKARRLAGYNSVVELADALNKAGFKNITEGQIYQLEKGQWPTREQLVTLSDFLNIPEQFLVADPCPCNQHKLTQEERGLINRLAKYFLDKTNNNKDDYHPPPSNK